MSAVVEFTTPAQAVRKMVDAGAKFSVRRRDDVLGVSFTYRVGEGGDINRCRAILAAVKDRPPAFFAAFKAQVQDLVGGAADA